MGALCVLLAAACGYDYRYRRIPNGLIVLMAAMGLTRRLWSGGPPGMLSYAGEAVFAAAMLYPFFKIGSVGAGDVKLLGAAAGYFPSEKILIFLFFSLLIAAVISLLKMWKQNSFRRRLGHLWGYLSEVVQKGSWQLYLKKEENARAEGICLSGPVLVSVLLYLGGAY